MRERWQGEKIHRDETFREAEIERYREIYIEREMEGVRAEWFTSDFSPVESLTPGPLRN